MKYLVIFNDNWADEMDIFGGEIWTESEKDNFETSLVDYFKDNCELTFYIGSNEEITYESKEAVMDTLTITPISEDEIQVLAKFNLKRFGMYPSEMLIFMDGE